MRSSVDLLLRALLCSVVIQSHAAAQQAITSATLGGRILDTSDSPVSAAVVEARDTGRGRTVTQASDADGRFQFLHLSPGEYAITISAPQLERVERRISLSLGQALDMAVTLRAAGRQDAVEVTERVELVESAKTQMSQSISPVALDSLPLNGRNYLDLALLAPGVARANTGLPQQFAETSAVSGSGLSVSGQRNLSNSFVVDGLSANDDAAGLAGTSFSQEVIREFQIINAGGNAEFGRASSGVINIVTRSGSNEWHGRGYGFMRNQRLDARHPLARSKDPLTQAQYGASAGGRLRANRAFLFSNFEQTRRNAAGFVTIAPVNVDAIRAAMPNAPVETGQYGTGWDTTNLFVKTDYNLGDRQQLTARYTLYDIASENARNVGGLNAVSRGTSLADRDHTIALSHLFTPSARNLIESRFQFTRSQLTAPGNDTVGPSVNIAGVANFGASTSSPTARDAETVQGSVTASFHRGGHVTKVGFDTILNRLSITFPSSQLAPVYAFSSLATFATGRYNTFQQAFGDPEQFQSNPNYAMFVQDEWKPLANVTLNLGVRYDVQMLPSPIRLDGNNIAPRLGIAWAPGRRNMVLRGSYGLYYDRIPLRATSNALQRDGSKYRVALLAFGQPGAPVFPARLQEFPSGQFVNITTIDPAIQSSYSHQASFEVEQQFGSGTTVSAGYQWVRGLHLILSRNVNVPTSATAINLGRPDSRFGNISRYEGGGDSYYNGLLVSMRSRLSRAAEFQVAYTLSKAIDNVGSSFFSSPQDSANVRDDRGLSDNDQRHRLTVAGVLDWRGWQLSPMFRYTSALPYNVQLNFDRNGDTNLNDRPLGVGRNTARGFNYASLDVRLSRSFLVSDRLRVQVLAEGFNGLNRANKAAPNNVIGNGVGVPLASFGRETGAFDPRQVQLGLRLSF